MLAQIIIGLIIIAVISAIAFGLYASLHSSATNSGAQQYALNLRGRVDQMFASNPNFSSFTTSVAKEAGLFSNAVASTLSGSTVTAPGGFKIDLAGLTSPTNQWTMKFSNLTRAQCGTLATTFLDSEVVSISINGSVPSGGSNPAYSSGSGGTTGGSSSSWPPPPANLISGCTSGGSNTITWTFAN